MKTRKPQGFTLVEGLIALILGSILIGGGIRLLALAARAELRSGRVVEASHSACQAQGWMVRDLDRIHHVPGSYPIAITRDPEDPTNVLLKFWVMYRTTVDGEAGYRPVSVRYAFDGAVLRRTLGTGETDAFDLGAGGRVDFVILEPTPGAAIPPGRYWNRLSYRITAVGSDPAGSRRLTLVGSRPFLVKASRESFPYFNRLIRL